MKTEADLTATKAFFAAMHATCPVTRDRVCNVAVAFERDTGRWPKTLRVRPEAIPALEMWNPPPVETVCGLRVVVDLTLPEDVLATCG